MADVAILIFDKSLGFCFAKGEFYFDWAVGLIWDELLVSEV